MYFRWLADAVLVLHVAIVLFVVGGLVLIVAGNRRAWRWVNALWFRGLHLAAIATVVAESWLGIVCPLTVFESWLRIQGLQNPHGSSFIAYWLQRLLYYDAPAWVFTIAYTAFGLLVAGVWWVYPPDTRRRDRYRDA